MSDIKVAYASAAGATITLASLASSSTLLTGRESTAIDNSSNLYDDYILSGFVTTGTTPTVSTQIEVWVVAEVDDSAWPDAFTGSDAGRSVTNTGVKFSVCKLAGVMIVSATSNVKYGFGSISVASLFGGVCPRKFLVWVTHNTAVNLNSTGGNQQVTTKGVYYTAS